jgi:hypothetical protein
MVGHITVEKIEEHEDGSATVVFECDDEAKKALINEGLISLLERDQTIAAIWAKVQAAQRESS